VGEGWRGYLDFPDFWGLLRGRVAHGLSGQPEPGGEQLVVGSLQGRPAALTAQGHQGGGVGFDRRVVGEGNASENPLGGGEFDPHDGIRVRIRTCGGANSRDQESRDQQSMKGIHDGERVFFTVP
jgi:hypothetical protein